MYNKYLITELTERAKNYGEGLTLSEAYKHAEVVTKDALIFSKIEHNFHPQSYKGITANPEYEKRFSKNHTSFPPELNIKELQSSNSSDALAMNIFCHPKITEWKGIRNLLHIDVQDAFSIEFGKNPGVKWRGLGDGTEVDVVINNIFCECKLTENDFTHKDKHHVEQYDLFHDVFHIDRLIQDERYYYNYQLIRNILAAAENSFRFVLFCDARRPDLAKNFYHTTRCIKDEKYLDLRMNCEIIYWQDIALVAGEDLRRFLIAKYGIGNDSVLKILHSEV